MEVRIAVTHAPREVVLEVEGGEAVEAAVAKALSDADGVLSLTDIKGRRVMVPNRSIAFIELGVPESRRVGFGAH